ncbi:hypothetical protein CPB83DRAFT_865131 [Crepidotus variabilis]|uniref:C2H2-type domain-containing protein n=1 Tax=Crepidotus variabilis TaxID=179855 RepID=A0A9P6E3M2_9AGAR|nr:hypothetical protein CPB83DRAFT_865131 [Crepidotus variabilis]
MTKSNSKSCDHCGRKYPDVSRRWRNLEKHVERDHALLVRYWIGKSDDPDQTDIGVAERAGHMLDIECWFDSCLFTCPSAYSLGTHLSNTHFEKALINFKVEDVADIPESMVLHPVSEADETILHLATPALPPVLSHAPAAMVIDEPALMFDNVGPAIMHVSSPTTGASSATPLTNTAMEDLHEDIYGDIPSNTEALALLGLPATSSEDPLGALLPYAEEPQIDTGGTLAAIPGSSMAVDQELVPPAVSTKRASHHGASRQEHTCNPTPGADNVCDAAKTLGLNQNAYNAHVARNHAIDNIFAFESNSAYVGTCTRPGPMEPMQCCYLNCSVTALTSKTMATHLGREHLGRRKVKKYGSARVTTLAPEGDGVEEGPGMESPRRPQRLATSRAEPYKKRSATSATSSRVGSRAVSRQSSRPSTPPLTAPSTLSTSFQPSSTYTSAPPPPLRDDPMAVDAVLSPSPSVPQVFIPKTGTEATLATAGFHKIVVPEEIFGQVSVPFQLLACVHCQRGVRPNNVTKHAIKHGSKFGRKAATELILWGNNQAARKLEGWMYGNAPIHNPQETKAQIPILEVKAGFCCGAPADVCSSSRVFYSIATLKEHTRISHPDTAPDTEWTAIKTLYQTLFTGRPVLFAVQPTPELTSSHPYSKYLRQYGRTVDSTKASDVSLSTGESTPLLAETGWDIHLKGPLSGGRKALRRLLNLTNLPTSTTGIQWLGKPLEVLVARYMAVTKAQGKSLNMRTRRLLVRYPNTGISSHYWRPITEKSLREYGRLLRRFIHSILSSLEANTSDYQFPLSVSDKARASSLKSKLQAGLQNRASLDALQDFMRPFFCLLGGFISDGSEATTSSSVMPFEVEDVGGQQTLEYDDESGDEEGDEHRDDDKDDADHGNNTDDGDDGDDGEGEEKEDRDEDYEANDEDEDEKDQAGVSDEEETLEFEAEDDGDEIEDDGEENWAETGGDESEDDGDGEEEDELENLDEQEQGEEEQDDSGLVQDKWKNVLECFMAVNSLRGDGTFRNEGEVTNMFSVILYLIRATIVYEARRRMVGQQVSEYQAVEDIVKWNLDPKLSSPYNSVSDYQAFTSSLVLNGNTAPTTRVSSDGMLITYRDHSLDISTWRQGIARLGNELKNELDVLCYQKDYGLNIPAVIEDDWASTNRGGSWTQAATFLQDPTCLMHEMFSDEKLMLGYLSDDGNLVLNESQMWATLQKFEAFAQKLAFYAFVTAGQTPRITEFVDHKFANSMRARTIFMESNILWLVVRRTKTESVTGKEAFIPTKCHPLLNDLLIRYLLLIRPVEAHLIHHLRGPSAYLVYSEFLWVTGGRRTSEIEMYKTFMAFTAKYFDIKLGVRQYRQIAVEIGRVFLGSEATVREREFDAIAAQAGHTAHVARSNYANEVGHLPRLSSDLLLRYARVSEMWWGVIGCDPSRAPMLPLRQREGKAPISDEIEKLKSFIRIEIKAMINLALATVWPIWLNAIVAAIATLLGKFTRPTR